MKTLIIFGSPRNDGCTAYLTKRLIKKLKGEVQMVNAYESAASPCIDCRYCREHPACMLKDDMQPIYEQIKESDNILIASPLHFSELSGPLLSLLSRLQVAYSARNFLKTEFFQKRKQGALILCGGGSGGAKKAEGTAKLLLAEMNASLDITVTSLHTDTIPPQKDGAPARDIDSLAAKWNERV